ncbi:SipW-dependent-type signal peptide-containing protein [Candidatus Saccharibacteria bacterium]|nr:SipW-dependent-type signal peptide-containing protein [Candidatus Saccharibacteria bacterium]
MYHKVRITVVSLVVMAICMLSSVTTLAYFTDTDGAMNNFVVGNMSTVLAIYDNVDDSENKHAFSTSDYSPLVDGKIPLYLQATNNGNIPVYQRFRVVIPIALSSVVTLNLPEMDEECTIVTTSESTCRNTDYTVTYKPSVSVDDVPKYAEYYIVSNEVLAKDGKTAEWPTVSLTIDGLNDLSEADKSLFATCEEDDNNCVLGIGIYSDAIQTAGFAGGAVSSFADFPETY